MGSIEDYKAQFETLSNRLRRLSDTYKLSYFLSGLKVEIRLPMFNPSNLSIAYSLSKLQEENMNLSKKSNKPILTHLPEFVHPYT